MTVYDTILNNLKKEMRENINDMIQEADEEDYEEEVARYNTMRERVAVATEIMEVIEVMRLLTWDVESALLALVRAAGADDKMASDKVVLGGHWDT